MFIREISFKCIHIKNNVDSRESLTQLSQKISDTFNSFSLVVSSGSARSVESTPLVEDGETEVCVHKIEF